MAVRRELNVFVACHDFVCALPASHVERLLLSEDVRRVGGESAVQVIEANRRAYACFNLGQLLGMPPTRGSHILLRASHAGAELALCLETGACLRVAELVEVTPLPPALFRMRRRALGAAFAVDASIRRGNQGAVGLALSIDDLLNTEEREAARNSLRGIKAVSASP